MERMGKLEFKQWLEMRTTAFAVSTFKLLDALPKKNSTQVIAHQLGKAASSIGANYHEANRAESRDDFVHKLAIAIKEASESGYWLNVLSQLHHTHKTICDMKIECEELRNLLQSIRTSISKRSKSGIASK